MPTDKSERLRPQKRRKGSLIYWGSENGEPLDEIRVPEAFRLIKSQEESAPESAPE